jgi:hypothetical protein
VTQRPWAPLFMVGQPTCPAFMAMVTAAFPDLRPSGPECLDSTKADRCTCAVPLLWTDHQGWVHLADGRRCPLPRKPPQVTATGLDRSAEQVAKALNDSAAGSGLHIRCYSELGGASLVGARGEAYVLPRRGGYAVEAWHHCEDEAYQIRHFATLADAVAAAAEAVGPW